MIEENAIRSEEFRDIYNFYRLFKVQKHAKRYARVDAKKGKLLRRWLREPLKVDKRVLAFAEGLKKKNAPKYLYRRQQQRMCHSLTTSKYLWLEKLLKFPKIITAIGFQKKVMIR